MFKALRKELNFLLLSQTVQTSCLECKSKLVGRNPCPVGCVMILLIGNGKEREMWSLQGDHTSIER